MKDSEHRLTTKPAALERADTDKQSESHPEPASGADPWVGSPANLTGAFMRNASLAGADLTGVIANNVNFYTIAGGTADASNATMTSAKFNDAYLAGADFGGSNAVLQSTSWNRAVLVGTNFTDADTVTLSQRWRASKAFAIIDRSQYITNYCYVRKEPYSPAVGR